MIFKPFDSSRTFFFFLRLRIQQYFFAFTIIIIFILVCFMIHPYRDYLINTKNHGFLIL